jgi:hypothetical protein
MLIEAVLLPGNLSSVSVRPFVIPFYYGSGSGSARAKSYGSYHGRMNYRPESEPTKLLHHPKQNDQ